MKLLTLATIFVIVSVASAVYHQCHDDEDCLVGCCAHSHTGNVCKAKGQKGDVCDLEGQHMADGVCGCADDFQCEKIDLSFLIPSDIAATANPLLEEYHFGMCAEKIDIGK